MITTFSLWRYDRATAAASHQANGKLNQTAGGKRESTYDQCYDKIQLHLLETGRN